MTVSVVKGLNRSIFTIQDNDRELNVFEKVCRDIDHTPTYDDILEAKQLEISNELAFDFLYRITCEGCTIKLY